MIPIKFDLNNTKMPIYAQIYHSLKDEIITGNIAIGTKLPSIRKLADYLDVSTTTIEEAYNQLIAEGFISSKPKSGYFVESLIDTFAIKTFPSYRIGELNFRSKNYKYDFHMSKNDFSIFPFNTWKRLSNQVISAEHDKLFYYGDPQGEEGLRYQISKYLRTFRSVYANPDQIIIGPDQYYLLSLLSHMLKKYTLSLGVENPSYPLISKTFKQNDFNIAYIPVDKQGISVERLYKSKVKIAVVTPSHHFPLGISMPVARRIELIDWAVETDGYIIEDDYDGEFRYQGIPLPSIQGIKQVDRVIYMGGFSQVLSPALCVHYLVLPNRLMKDYHQLKQELLLEQSASRLHQRTLELFMKEGVLETHLRKIRKIYKEKSELLTFALKKHFKDDGSISGSDAGFHLLLTIQSEKTEQELLHLAEQANIRIGSASYTWHVGHQEERKEFLLGFSGIEKSKIEEGVKTLRNVWFDI